jgi:hypothetical protein
MAGSAAQAWARGGRWFASVLVLFVAAILCSLAVVAVYLRDEVLDTDTYVATVAPLGTNPTVRTAVAQRLTDEIITRSDLQGLTTSVADKLVQEGAPSQVTDLVGPVVSGVSSFLNSKINDLMATQRFEDAWRNINRLAHQGLVTVLLGQQGKIISSEGNTVTLDIGELLTLVKQQLVSEGLTIFGKIPDVSIQYTVLESDQLPTIRTYTRLLDAAGTWLPWVALVLLFAGVLTAPNWRRGIMTGAIMVGLVALLFLAALYVVRTYYVDNLPATIKSPQAAEVVINTMLRFLVEALQTLVAAMLVFLVGAFLAGPSRFAVAIRRLLNKGIDALAGLLARAGAWVAATGRVLAAAYHPLHIGLVLLAVVIFVLVKNPGISAVVWTTVAVVLMLLVMEVFVRAGPRVAPKQPASA